jgi:hypothetical protein
MNRCGGFNRLDFAVGNYDCLVFLWRCSRPIDEPDVIDDKDRRADSYKWGNAA